MTVPAYMHTYIHTYTHTYIRTYIWPTTLTMIWGRPSTCFVRMYVCMYGGSVCCLTIHPFVVLIYLEGWLFVAFMFSCISHLFFLSFFTYYPSFDFTAHAADTKSECCNSSTCDGGDNKCSRAREGDNAAQSVLMSSKRLPGETLRRKVNLKSS